MKPKLSKLAISLLLLLVFNGPLSAQRFDSLLLKLDSDYPQEKIHVHFDRSVYTPGETIWMKAYLFNGATPSEISKTVYAELLDEQGKVIDRKSAPVLMAGAAAAFDLPSDLKSSIVFVRAYTRWMLNFDTSFVFVRSIPIAKRAKTTPISSEKSTSAVFLQFFPEGGDLVAGLESRVAFKATDNKGLPIAVSGQVLNKAGKPVATLTTRHDGMGAFALEPLKGEEYRASWKDASGKLRETPLPKVKPSGLVLKAENLGNKISFAIQKTPDAPVQAVHIVAHLHQQLMYRARANLANRTAAGGSIPLENIPAGIVQLTVFDEEERPLAERLIFANQDDYYFITDLNAVMKGFTKRARNVIQIDVPDTIASNLSISVTDASLNPPQKHEEDIFSGLLLTGDIKGYVHQPSYYFSGTDSAASHLDLVMMTNGWRRFRWEDVLAGRFPQIKNPPDGYLAITGKVSGINKSSLVMRELIGMLESKDGGRNVINIPVNQDGTFSSGEALFYDTVRMFYQFNNDKDKVLTSQGVFQIGNNLMNQSLQAKPEIVIPYRPDSLLISKNEVLYQRRKEIEDENRRIQTLAAVEVTAKSKSKEEKYNDEYSSGMFAGQGNVFVVEDDPFAVGAMNVFSYLQGRVAGLQITTSGTSTSLSWRGGVPGTYLDEIQTDVENLQYIPMNDVAMIKIFDPPFMGGFGGGSGAIVVYTKKGRFNRDDSKGLSGVGIPGYSVLKEFYSPDYAKYNKAAADEPDLRTTLYWNPIIITDKNKKRIILSFYNNDVTNKFRVVIEGINVEGKLTRIEKIFQQ